jgi:hypothetical protein
VPLLCLVVSCRHLDHCRCIFIHVSSFRLLFYWLLPIFLHLCIGRRCKLGEVFDLSSWYVASRFCLSIHTEMDYARGLSRITVRFC